MELTSFILYFVILIQSSIYGTFYGISFVIWINHFLITGIIIIVFLAYMSKTIGINDFRFQLTFHIINIVVSALTYGKIDEFTGINEPVITMNAVKLWVPTFFPSLITWVGGFYATFHIMDNFLNEINSISNKFGDGEFTKISNENILNDKVLGAVAIFYNEMVQSIQDLISELYLLSSTVKKTSDDLTDSSEEATASVEEISATSNSMAEGSAQQSEMLYNMSTNFDIRGQTIDRIVKMIFDESKTVEAISFQTNILALNAGIEASRAGDYGRGFAVVAENVRKLSDQSNQAASRIKNVVEEISSSLTNMFNEFKEAIESISSVSEETAASSEEVAAASQEINNSLVQMNEMTIELNNIISKSHSILSKLENTK